MSHFYERVDGKTIDYEEEISKIISILKEKYGFESSLSIIDANCFRPMELSSNYLHLQTMIEDVTKGNVPSEQFICLSELILSIYEQIDLSYIDTQSLEYFVCQQLSALKNLIFYDLNKLNLDCKIIDSDLGPVASIGPKNELLEDVLSSINNKSVESRLILYNAISTKGNIEIKENVLCSIYSFVEGYLKDQRLLQMNKRLFDNVSFLYNNLNMKHNNDRINDTFFYQETLSNRESWLDNLFHDVLIVLASKKEQEIDDGIRELKAKKKAL